MSALNTCRTCRHWKPYWTGEAWGVRSLADAPINEQARIMELVRRRQEEGPYFLEEELKQRGAYDVNNLPTFKNWPEWGECKLTDLDSKDRESSLACAIDGSEYMAVLRCHHTFGCVQYAATEPVPEEDDRT